MHLVKHLSPCAASLFGASGQASLSVRVGRGASSQASLSVRSLPLPHPPFRSVSLRLSVPPSLQAGDEGEHYIEFVARMTARETAPTDAPKDIKQVLG